MGPAPISWPPSQYWDGDVGSWSSFALRVGNPAQTVRVIPSTAGQSTWVIAPSGCPPDEPGISPSLPCPQSRGGLFDPSRSSSWHALSNNSLGLDANLGYGDLSALYGLDTIQLGFSDSIGGPRLDSQILSALAPEHYFVGLFGLNHQATNLSNFSIPHPSALTTLKENSLIPSLSWGYTAGAQYRSKGVFGSLTFGGYDASRFYDNGVSFKLAPDVTRDLVVGLQSIMSTFANGSIRSLLPSPILSFIDSTQPFIYLPVESCRSFEEAFGLVWNETYEVYWVDYDLHQKLLSVNPNITFGIGNTEKGGPTVEIVLPYASFDLQAMPPAAPNSTRLFPLRRAANSSQYTLGRTFMQEAYVITDYERSNFSVSQARFADGVPNNLVTIHSATLSPSSNSTSLNPPATPPESQRSHKTINVASIATAVVVFILIIAGAIYAYIRRRSRRLRKQREGNASQPSNDAQEVRPLTIDSVREIDNNSMVGPFRELPDTSLTELRGTHSLQAARNSISETAVPPSPILHELRTHRSSQEKVITRKARGQIHKTSTTTQPRSQSHISASTRNSTRRPTRSIRTVTAASTQKSDSRSSTDSISLKTAIYASYMRKPLDLNRSLPPTPISESPMVSPLAQRFTNTASSRLRSQSVGVAPPVPISAVTAPPKLVSRYSVIRAAHRDRPRGLSLAVTRSVPSHTLSAADYSIVSPLLDKSEAERTCWI
ncbi:hypothetical protein G7Y79_00057g090770 [Physcia stellaris]|nr:hypothetical protein G7Y79_00057g090770 [Physcia stellaris]